MPTDRISDDEIRRINDPYNCFDDVHKRLAAELLQLRATLEKRTAQWSGAEARIDELEAAQRPPLGYVVGWVTSCGWLFAREYRGPIEDLAEAERELAAELTEVPGWELLEVREVRP